MEPGRFASALRVPSAPGNGVRKMNWMTYFAVSAAVVIVGLALGVTLPLVSFRLESWGYGPFAIGVMAGMPAIGVLVGARLTGRLAGWFGTPQTLRLCLLASAASVALLSVMPSYPLWLLLRLLIGISLTVVFVLGESWINQLVEDRLRGRLVALYGTGFALSQLCGPLLLTLLPVYLVREGFAQQMALIMVSAVVVGDAALQLPIGWMADRVPRQTLFRCCGGVLLLSSLSIPSLLHTPLIWVVLVLFGASAGGLYTLSLILVGQRYRDDALVRANSHIALLWGVGCLLGPLSTGAASQWVSGHALPILMAVGAALFVWLAFQRGAFREA